MTNEERFLMGVGRVVANAVLLENRMSVFLWKLISGDQLVGQIVTAHLSSRGVTDLLGALGGYKIKDAALLAELHELLDEAEKAGKKRNDIVHSLWGVATGTRRARDRGSRS